MRESPSELHKFINEWEMRYSVCGGAALQGETGGGLAPRPQD